MSTSSLPAQVEDDTHDHDRAHSTSRPHSHARIGSHASNTSIALQREKPPPTSLDSLDGWTRETTAGGKNIITPGLDASNSPYSPPIKHSHGDHSHSHSHVHHHSHHDHDFHTGHGHGHVHAHRTDDGKVERSLFTRTLLPYTARFPILHAILVEKDSRRIFYFMTYVFCAHPHSLGWGRRLT